VKPLRLFILLALSLSLSACAQTPQGGAEVPQGGAETLAEPVDTTTHRLTLLFVGDLMQHQGQERAARKGGGAYDFAPYYEALRADIEAADLAVANLEVTLGGAPYTGYPQFSAPDQYLTDALAAGFDIMLTANNHCLDRRRKGLERTLTRLEEANVLHCGTYRTAQERVQNYPLFVEKNGIRIAFLNYTYATNGIPVDKPNVVNLIDREQIARDIAAAKAGEPDAIIACMHWGEEYWLTPTTAQKNLADWLFAQGVTHIIGGHPHVVQPMEVRTDSLGERHFLAYSLGNFVSNMTKVNTDGGLLVNLTLEKQNGQTRLVDANYRLFWVSRPALSGKRNFRVLPVDYPRDSLNAAERQRMSRFENNARNLFKKYNKGI